MATSLVLLRQRLCPYLACTLKSQIRKGPSSFCNCYKKVLPSTSVRSFHISKLRCSDTSANEETKAAPESSNEKVAPPQPSFTTPEKHIPISRYTLIRMICEDKDFLTDAEKKLLPSFTNALDTAIINRYHHVVQVGIEYWFNPISCFEF